MSKKQEKHTVSVAIKTDPLPHVVLDQKTELLLEIRDMLKRFFERVDATGTLGK